VPDHGDLVDGVPPERPHGVQGGAVAHDAGAGRLAHVGVADAEVERPVGGVEARGGVDPRPTSGVVAVEDVVHDGGVESVGQGLHAPLDPLAALGHAGILDTLPPPVHDLLPAQRAADQAVYAGAPRLHVVHVHERFGRVRIQDEGALARDVAEVPRRGRELQPEGVASLAHRRAQLFFEVLPFVGGQGDKVIWHLSFFSLPLSIY